MTAEGRLSVQGLNEVFVHALKTVVIWHSEIGQRPLEVDLSPPLPTKIRLYLYNLTSPPGGRSLSEYKIQLIVTGQLRGERGRFDYGDARQPILAGYNRELQVFALWDAGMYPTFGYSRNVQITAGTLVRALTGHISEQQRRVRDQGLETVLATRPDSLAEALQRRMIVTEKRLLEL